MVCYYNHYNSEDTNFLDIPIGLRFQLRPNTIVNSEDGVDFAMLFTLWSSLSASTQHDGKAGGLQILCCQGINVTDYNFNLDALALKPSDFCNVRV
jgi:hypothetical protein